MPIAWRTRPIYVSRSYCEAGSSRVPGSEADMISGVEAVVKLVVSRNDVRRDGFETGKVTKAGGRREVKEETLARGRRKEGGFSKSPREKVGGGLEARMTTGRGTLGKIATISASRFRRRELCVVGRGQVIH